MQSFPAAKIAYALHCLTNAWTAANSVQLAETVISLAGSPPIDDETSRTFKQVRIEAAHQLVLHNLDEVMLAVHSLPLPARVIAKLTRVKDSIAAEQATDFDAKAASVRLSDFVSEILLELLEPKFLHIDPDKRPLYEQKEPPFGPTVADKFPDAAKDIAAGCRCFALDEWTASVFHFMRALEEPMHQLAAKVGVVLSGPIDLENWKNVVDQIDSAIGRHVKALEQTAKSHERNEELKLYGELSMRLRHFKNACRNGVAHRRQHFDERDAKYIFDGAKDLMQKMAEVA